MATSNVNFVSALGAGSGIDTKSLAQNLVEAEKAPRKKLIDNKITKEEAHITGYGAIKSLLSTLQGALGKLNDVSDFSSIAAANTQPGAFGANASPNALAGSYDINIAKIAKATRLATNHFSDTQMSLGTAPFTLSFIQSNALQTEQQTVTFQDLNANESVTVDGLTLTATTSMSAQEVATAFKNSATSQTTSAYNLTGSLSSDWQIGSLSGDGLTFISQISNSNVNDIAISSTAAVAPTLQSLDGSDGLNSAKSVTVSTATPLGIMSAVNAQTATTGIRAQMIKTGTGYSLLFTGATGAANDFKISGLPAQLSMRSTPLQTAQDAELTVNGLTITSASNDISEAIDGVTLNLYTATTGDARLDLNRQTASIKDSIKGLVSAYNDFEAGLKELGDSKSTLDQFGGTLAGDSTVNTVRNLIRSMFIKDSKDGKYYPDGDKSQPALNPDINAAWQVGISFDRYGKMNFDEAKFDKSANEHFDQVIAYFTANTQGQSVYSKVPGGLAGDAFKSIDKMLRTTGLLAQQTDSANTRIKQYNEQLTKLEDRMNMLLASYTKQFSAMDNIVGESNSTRTSLKSSFDGLMAAYTKN